MTISYVIISYIIRSQNKQPLQRSNVFNVLSDVKPTSKLTLHNVTPEDTGTYMCVSQAADSQTTWTSFHFVYVCSKYNHLLCLSP